MVLKSKITKKIVRNPIDEELLKKLKIKKECFPETNEIFYVVLLNNNEIGSAVYRTNKNVVDSTGIDKEYRRKGINTWLYNYIEKDQGVRLIPSKTLMREGELFWRNRLKRSNPTDEEFLKKIKIEKINTNGFFVYEVYYDDRFIGIVSIAHNSHQVGSVEILYKEYRRKGVASYVYNYIENDLGIKLRPSDEQLPAGKKFWEARLKKNPSSKPKPKNARPIKTSKTKIPR